MPNEGSKRWYQSTSIWGSVVAGLSLATAKFLGGPINELDQAALVETLIAIAGGVGVLWAVYGRVRATKRIGG